MDEEMKNIDDTRNTEQKENLANKEKFVVQKGEVVFLNSLSSEDDEITFYDEFIEDDEDES